jgi:heptose-I-phosphate ethanolaminephosphotransferase
VQFGQQAQQKTTWANLVWVYLFFWYFSAVQQGLIWSFGVAGFEGLRNTIFLSFLWIVPLLIFPRWARPISAVLGIFLWAVSLIGMGYFFIYRQEFSQSVVFVILESNPAESTEYMSQYFHWWQAGALIIYSLVPIFLWRKIRPVQIATSRAVLVAIFCLFCSIGYPFVRFANFAHFDWKMTADKMQKRMEVAVPWQLLFAYFQYQTQLANVQENLKNNAALPPLKNLQDSTGNLPRTLVLVIGESTSRFRMSLYGYARKTTPRLDALHANHEIYVFDDVASPRAYTIEVLSQALTFADADHPERATDEPNLLNIMKQAGYKIYWITNQQTMTKRNTLLTTFSQQADEAIYLNNNRRQNSDQYDGEVLKPFADALQDPADKKFIVVHLLGTHSNYKYRYPADFAKFTDDATMPTGLNDEERALYNSYDDAVLYTDFVISSLIDEYQKSNDNGFLLYLSDHGEEVFDSPPHDILGRNEGGPTRAMFSVPFLVYESPEWKKLRPLDLQAAEERPYSSSDLIYSVTDLAGLTYDRFSPTESVFNPAFKPQERWIGEEEQKQDFDALTR